MVQGGDVVKNDGSSGESIYGPFFDDEILTIPVWYDNNCFEINQNFNWIFCDFFVARSRIGWNGKFW